MLRFKFGEVLDELLNVQRFDVGDLFCSELRQYVIVDDLLIEMQRCRRHRDGYGVKVLRYEVAEL